MKRHISWGDPAELCKVLQIQKVAVATLSVLFSLCPFFFFFSPIVTGQKLRHRTQGKMTKPHYNTLPPPQHHRRPFAAPGWLRGTAPCLSLSHPSCSCGLHWIQPICTSRREMIISCTSNREGQKHFTVLEEKRLFSFKWNSFSKHINFSTVSSRKKRLKLPCIHVLALVDFHFFSDSKTNPHFIRYIYISIYI